MKFKRKDKAKGITLIALVITIIVMIILAGVSINAIVGDNGIITRSMEASFKADVSQYKEEIQTYLIQKQASDDYNYSLYAGDSLNTVYTDIVEQLYTIALANGETINTAQIVDITSMEDDEYISHLGVEGNVITWYTDDGDSNEVQWCIDLGIQVYIEGYGYKNSNGFVLPDGVDGSYTAMGNGLYACTPDLSNFSTGNTYYVTYDSSYTTATTGNKIYNDVPDGWYDYANQSWANVVTVANNHMAYWVWIPRYAYKISSTTTTDTKKNSTETYQQNVVEIRFLNTDNEWTEDGETYTDWTTLQLDGWVLADAFTFDDVDVAGIWVSKYEISDPREPIGFSVQTDTESITVYSITWDGESSIEDGYETLKEQVEEAEVTIEWSGSTGSGKVTSKLPYKIEGLTSGISYTVKVTTPTYGVNTLTLSKTVTTTETDVSNVTAPDLTGFNSENTYYAEFTSSSTTGYTIGNNITIASEADTDTYKDDRLVATNTSSTGLSGDWYDYSSQKWANIFTINHDTGEGAFWVWIPRYEYYVDEEQGTCDIIFITANKKTADSGYTIPDAFTFDGEELSGIWVMKYEITDIQIPKGFYSTVTSSSIEITNLTYTDGNGYSSSSAYMPNQAKVSIVEKSTGSSDGITISGTYSTTSGYTDYYVIGSKSSNTVEISGLTAGKTYTVTLVIPYAYSDDSRSSTKSNFQVTVSQDITLPSSDSDASVPDVSGFLTSSTCFVYPVIFASSDTDVTKATLGSRITSETNLSSISGWYDYDNQMWANILVSDTNLSDYVGETVGSISNSINVNMFVWIPKYAYKYTEDTGVIEVIMLDEDDTVPSGYVVPDAFTFGSTSLTGFWSAKYEIATEASD